MMMMKGKKMHRKNSLDSVCSCEFAVAYLKLRLSLLLLFI